MAGFLYFIDGHTDRVHDANLREWRLTHAFDRVPFNSPITGSTPSGEAGTLIVDQSRLGPYQPRFLPELQHWERVPGEAYWLGFYHEAPPTPVDLSRKVMSDGYLVELTGGFQWRVPLVRKFLSPSEHDTCLPRYRQMAYRIDRTTVWVDGDIQREYAHLVDIAHRFWDNWLSSLLKAANEKKPDFSIELDHPEKDAAALLGANYVVSEFELSALRVFSNDDNHAASEVLRLSCDCRNAMAWMADNEGS